MLREALQRLIDLTQGRRNGVLYRQENEGPHFMRINLTIVGLYERESATCSRKSSSSGSRSSFYMDIQYPGADSFSATACSYSATGRF
jgi:hypothetical protein